MAESTTRRRTRRTTSPPETETKDTPPSIHPPRERAPSSRSIEVRLTTLYTSFSLAFAAAGDQHCAQLIVDHAPDIARSWDNLAKENPRVKMVIERILEGGAWSGVIITHGSLLYGIARHHDLVPKSIAQTADNVNGSGNTSSKTPPVPSSPPPRGTVAVAGNPETENGSSSKPEP